jgi:hypothetical protein
MACRRSGVRVPFGPLFFILSLLITCLSALESWFLRKEVLFLANTCFSSLEIAIVLALSTASFTGIRRERIKNSNGGKCIDCELNFPAEDLIASHLNHDRSNPCYNHDSNGVPRCPTCEAIYHLSHIGNAAEIGLPEDVNLGICYGWWMNLTKSGRRTLFKKCPDQMEVLAKKFRLDR